MERFYYVKDHLGSIRQTINEDGEIVAAQDYYAYGEIIPGRSYNAATEDEKYKFTEKERDTETNYDYFGARYYNSKLGLWLSVDPLADKYPGWSPYNYVLGNPLRLVDKDGKEGDDYTAAFYANYNNLSYEGQKTYEDAFYTTSGVASAFLGGAFAVANYGSAIGGFIAANAPRINNFFNAVIDAVTPGPSSKISMRNPDAIRFTQNSIGKVFKDGSSVNRLIKNLGSGKTKAGDLPAIRTFVKNGKTYSLDNRRLYAFKKAGVKIRTTTATQEEIKKESWKFTTKNDGTSIELRGD